MDVRGLHEPELVSTEVERLTVPESARARLQSEPGCVERDREHRADELRVLGPRHEPVHAAVLVTLPVQQHDVGQPRRIEDLANRAGDGLVLLVPSRVHKRRRLVVDQELVERDAGRWGPHRDPVDPADDVIDRGALHVAEVTRRLKQA